MPSSTISSDNKQNKIEFNEATHIYKMNGDQKCISVTTLVGKYFPKFDLYGVSERVALKTGKTPEQVRKEWQENSQAACNYGTHVHTVCEDTVGRRDVRNEPADEKEEGAFKIAKMVADVLYDKFEQLEPEKVVFDPEYKIAGCIDLLAKKGDGYVIFDYKTNKKIEMDNKWGEYGLGPLAHLPHCEFYHYAMQLSLYEEILKHNGYIPMDAKVKRCLIHIKPDGYKLLPVPDLSKETKAMINNYRLFAMDD